MRSAWGARGLQPGACFGDAGSEAATTAAEVDLWVCTPSCEQHSKRNHGRTAAAQGSALAATWAALAYVRARRPSVVVLENVAEASVTEPLTGMLARLHGYTVETSTLDPRWTAGEPVARERRFWVLTRTSAARAVRT